MHRTSGDKGRSRDIKHLFFGISKTITIVAMRRLVDEIKSSFLDDYSDED